MKFNCGVVILSTLFLLTLTKAQTQMQLQCYVCEDCPEITDSIPKLECNEDYFNTGGTTMSSVMTTTPSEPPATTPVATTTTEAETTTTTSTSTKTESTTMEDTTTTEQEETTTDTTTLAPTTLAPTPPTPATAGPVITQPTPPNVGTTAAVINLVSLVNKTEGSLNRTDADYKVEGTVAVVSETTTPAANVKEYTNSTQFRVRQQRAITNTDVTYHCFTIQKNVNGSMTTDRGCSRVTTEQAVCNQLQDMNNHTISKCTPCSLSLCNGSGVLSASMATLLVACIAALMRH